MNLLPRAGVHHLFVPDQIVAITANTNYSYVHLINGERVLKSRPVLFYAKKYPDFLRIHKNALINPQHASQFRRSKANSLSGYVIMTNDLRFDVSRRRVQQVSQVLTNL